MRMPRAEIPLPELLMFAVAIRESEPDLYEAVVRDIQSFRRERDGKEVKDFESLKALQRAKPFGFDIEPVIQETALLCRQNKIDVYIRDALAPDLPSSVLEIPSRDTLEVRFSRFNHGGVFLPSHLVLDADDGKAATEYDTSAYARFHIGKDLLLRITGLPSFSVRAFFERYCFVTGFVFEATPQDYRREELKMPIDAQQGLNGDLEFLFPPEQIFALTALENPDSVFVLLTDTRVGKTVITSGSRRDAFAFVMPFPPLGGESQVPVRRVVPTRLLENNAELKYMRVPVSDDVLDAYLTQYRYAAALPVEALLKSSAFLKR